MLTLNSLSPVAISAIFSPAESPGGAGGMSYTAVRRILLQLTRLSPAVPRAFMLNQGGIGKPYVRNFCPQAHISEARKNRSPSDSCDPRGGIARCRRASGTQEQEYPPPLPLGTADPATVRRESDPRIIGDHPGAGVPTR